MLLTMLPKKIRKVIKLLKTYYGRIELRRILRDQFLKINIRLSGFFFGYLFIGPRLVGIEPTNRCNLNCLMCSRNYWDKAANKLGDMSIERFKSRILPYLTSLQTVNLQCLGEPLLAGGLLEMIVLCRAKGCRVIFTTNGIMLAKFARELVEANVDLITVSIDGIKNFKKIRGIEIASILFGISAINSAKSASNKTKPEIALNFVLMKDNLEELPDLVDLANENKIEGINVIHIVVHSKDLIGQSVLSEPERAQKYFSEAAALAKKFGIRLSLPPLRDTGGLCLQPFDTIYINWNLDLRPCCMSTINEKGALKIGSLNSASLNELWNSSMIRSLRLAVLGKKPLSEFCQNCTVQGCSLNRHIRILAG